jgi:hypothetical protein
MPSRAHFFWCSKKCASYPHASHSAAVALPHAHAPAAAALTSARAGARARRGRTAAQSSACARGVSASAGVPCTAACDLPCAAPHRCAPSRTAGARAVPGRSGARAPYVAGAARATHTTQRVRALRRERSTMGRAEGTFVCAARADARRGAHAARSMRGMRCTPAAMARRAEGMRWARRRGSSAAREEHTPRTTAAAPAALAAPARPSDERPARARARCRLGWRRTRGAQQAARVLRTHCCIPRACACPLGACRFCLLPRRATPCSISRARARSLVRAR